MENKSFIIRSLFIAFLILFIAIILLFLNSIFAKSISDNSSAFPEDRNTFLDNNSCNVAVIPLQGTIVQSVPQVASGTQEFFADAGKIVQKIKDADNAINIKALVLEVDSPGGYGSAPDFILNELDNFSKRKVAQVFGVAASGGYWVAIGTEKIFAQKSSDIGSIGVTSSFVNNSKSLEDKGEKYIDVSTGEYKTLGEPSKPITEKEVSFLKNKLQKMEDVFIEEVAQHRNLSKEIVAKLATGETWIAADAKSLGLIDDIGYTKDVNNYLQKILGLEKKEDLVFCY